MRDMFTNEIGIDMGTANTLIYVANKGITLREPSIAAVGSDNEPIAFGRDAQDIFDRTPGNFFAHKPISKGAVSDFETAASMLGYFVDKALNRQKKFAMNQLKRTKALLSVPCNLTTIERHAFEEVSKSAGINELILIEEPLCDALGAGLKIDAPDGKMLINIGEGKTQAAIISLGGIVESANTNLGGEDIDNAIILFMQQAHGMTVGKRMAERIKRSIGCAQNPGNSTMQAHGRATDTGLPLSAEISQQEVFMAISPTVERICACAVEVLQNAPPELAGDIANNGILMCGGGSKLYGIARLLAKKTDLRIVVAQDAQDCAVIGTGRAIERTATGQGEKLGRIRTA